MVNLHRTLCYLFPGSDPYTSWRIRNDGNGEYISYFNPALGARPTEDQMAAVVLAPSIPPITDLQIRLALNKMNLRAQVEAAVAAGSQDLRDWWDRSTQIHRDNPLVAEMISAIGVSQEQADALWLLGETL